LSESCSPEAEQKCHDDCREENYELLDELVFELLGGGNQTLFRRRRGVLPDFVLDFLGDYLRQNGRWVGERADNHSGAWGRVAGWGPT